MNPFSTCHVRPESSQYRFALDVANNALALSDFATSFASHLRTQRRLAIVGPHGSGKTTLLRSLEPSLLREYETLASLRLSSSDRCPRRTLGRWLDEQLLSLPNPAASTCLIVDGLEQLGWLSRRLALSRIAKRPGTVLIVTSHQPLAAIRTAWTTTWNHELARALTREKISHCDDSIQRDLIASYDKQLAASGASPNLRDVWFSLYDRYEILRRKTICARTSD